MQFNCLIWYSNLALPSEDNEFVANFLGQACKVIQKEIDEVAGNKYHLNLEFLHIEKGEEGLKQLFGKFSNMINRLLHILFFHYNIQNFSGYVFYKVWIVSPN